MLKHPDVLQIEIEVSRKLDHSIKAEIKAVYRGIEAETENTQNNQKKET